jgi:hypothetical protein
LERWDGVVWTGYTESSGSINCWETIERLHNWKPLEQCSVS